MKTHRKAVVSPGWVERCKARMVQLGLNQTDLAKARGLTTHASITRQWHGKLAVRREHIEAYAGVLRCDPDWLAHGEGPAPSVPLDVFERARETGGKNLKTPAERIRYVRLSLGISQADLAQRMPCRRQYIHKLESGEIEDPGSQQLFRLQDVSGFSAWWIATGRGPMKWSAPVEGGAGKAPDAWREALDSSITVLGTALGDRKLPLTVYRRILVRLFEEYLAGKRPRSEDVADALGMTLAVLDLPEPKGPLSPVV